MSDKGKSYDELLDEVKRLRTRVVEYETLVEKQKRIEQELRASELRFQSVSESAHDAIITADEQGIVVFWNRGAEEMFGYFKEEIIGKPLALLMPERYRAAHRAGLERLRRTGEAKLIGRTVELEGLDRNGREFPIELSLAMWEAEGEHFYSGIIRDITQRKESEAALRAIAEKLERSNQELQQFAYVASHDLQEPLRMVASYLQLVEQRYKGRLDSDADEFIAYAVDGAKRMQRLINDLLTYSRVGTQGQSFMPVDTGEIVEQVLHQLQMMIRESGAEVRMRGELPVVMGDEGQLIQLFQNLIGNAIKFRGEGPPQIEIAARREPGEWRFSVRDNGIGIDPQYGSRIFLIFQRLHARGNYPGTGIGLAICAKIIERHGGRIWVESQPGEGSTFYFTIPIRKKDNQG